MSNDLQLTELGKRTVGLTNHITTLTNQLEALTAQRDALRAACVRLLDDRAAGFKTSSETFAAARIALALCDKEETK